MSESLCVQRYQKNYINRCIKRNILSDILLQSSKKYPSKRDLIIAAEDLYSASIYNSTERIGKYIMTSFTLQVLNDKFTEEDNLNKGIEFLREIVFNFFAGIYIKIKKFEIT